MSKDAVFTMKLEPELHAEFMAEAQASHRPASQILREFMREYVQSQQQAREYADFVHRKVEMARMQIKQGQYRSNEEASAEYMERRAEQMALLTKTEAAESQRRAPEKAA